MTIDKGFYDYITPNGECIEVRYKVSQHEVGRGADEHLQYITEYECEVDVLKVIDEDDKMVSEELAYNYIHDIKSLIIEGVIG